MTDQPRPPVLRHLGTLIREPRVQAAAAVATLPVASAGLQAMGISTDVNHQSLSVELLDLRLWFVLSMTALFGGAGGVIAELLSLHGKVELPHRVPRGRGRGTRLAQPRNMIDFGLLSRMLLGGAAALAMLSVYAPTGAMALVVNALIAGSAATGVFRLVQGRLLGQPAATRPAPRQLHSVPTEDTSTRSA